MDFKYRTKYGVPRDITALDRILKELGVETLEEALERERAKIRLNGYTPITTPQPEPSSLEIKPSPIKARLPYADTDDTF